MAQLSSLSQNMSVTPTSTSTLSKAYHGSGLFLSSFPPLILLGRKRLHHTDFCNYRSLLFSDTGILLTEQLYFLPIPTKSPLTWTLSCCKPFHYANYSGFFLFLFAFFKLIFYSWLGVFPSCFFTFMSYSLKNLRFSFHPSIFLLYPPHFLSLSFSYMHAWLKMLPSEQFKSPPKTSLFLYFSLSFW